jgi:selenocysteine lyase/cysteine desulfurase
LYYDDIEEREDAGTPPIVQKIRASLAFWVKEHVGYDTMGLRERVYSEMAMNRLAKNPNVRVLGNTRVDRLPIFSFLVYPAVVKQSLFNGFDEAGSDEIVTENMRSSKQLPLHGRFVTRLLNDLFGIQARGGCACAGPYGHLLLDVDKELSLSLRSAILEVFYDRAVYHLFVKVVHFICMLSFKLRRGSTNLRLRIHEINFQGYSGLKPGWTRLSFSYYLSKEEFKFILSAVEFIAAYGHRFLPLYKFDWITGNWTFRKQAIKYHIMREELSLGAEPLKRPNHKTNPHVVDKLEKPQAGNHKFQSYLESANKIALSLPDVNQQTLSIPKGVHPELVLFHI